MKGMRITAGTLKGRRLALPPGEIRPTSSRAREAVFNILSDEIPGCRFLDLFAGSGVMSIEAISRGASHALAVEIAGRAVAAIKTVARELDLPLDARRGDVLRFLASSSGLEPFDVVYADPPYDFAHYGALISAIDRELPLHPGAVVVVEHRKKRRLDEEIPLERLSHRESRSWGQISVEIFDLIERNKAPDPEFTEASQPGDETATDDTIDE